MVDVDRRPLWHRIDLSAAGMATPDPTADERTQCHDWMVYAAAAHQGQGFLYWAQLHGIGQLVDIALAKLGDAIAAADTTAADTDEKGLFDPYTVVITQVAVMFAIRHAEARALVGQAVAAAERLPKTTELLREGSIGRDMFTAVTARTDIVDDPALVDAVDTDLAHALADAGHISAKAAEKIADRIVTRHDRDAVRRRRDKVVKRKNMTSRDYPDGLGGLNITADAEEVRLAAEAVNALVAGVCPNDPRTVGQRRSAAAIARLRGLPFTCGCTDKDTCTATLTDEAISDRQARIVIHAVCQKTTLDGHDDEPGYLDGHGPISADHARDLQQRPDAIVRDLDLGTLVDPEEIPEVPALIEHTAQPADPYRPVTALDTLTRGLFGTCTVPGCESPAWSCELDHVEEYDQICPASGGPTCLCNLGPKCKFHHLLKTHLNATDPEAGWLDDQWTDDDGRVWTSTTVHGITVATAAPNQWAFPQLRDLRCPHQSTAPPESPETETPGPPAGPPSGGGLKATTAYKHAWRKAARARLRRLRDKAGGDDPPPF